MLTQNDIHEIEEIVDTKLDAKIKNLPTKDDFFTRMDQLSGQIQAVREEQTLHQRQHDEIDERIDRVEKKLQLSPTT